MWLAMPTLPRPPGQPNRFAQPNLRSVSSPRDVRLHARTKQNETKCYKTIPEDSFLPKVQSEVEQGDKNQILRSPEVDYSKKLISAVPIPDACRNRR